MTSVINPGHNRQRWFSRFIVPELLILTALNIHFASDIKTSTESTRR